MNRTLVFLQNAWSSTYANREWPRESWLRALARSRSGQRLRIMINDLESCQNTTPCCGATVSSKLEPDHDHIKMLLAYTHPKAVVACGAQAEKALVELWPGPLLVVPHPAHRLLTNALYRRARTLLTNGLTSRLALRQLRGDFKLERL